MIWTNIGDVCLFWIVILSYLEHIQFKGECGFTFSKIQEQNVWQHIFCELISVPNKQLAILFTTSSNPLSLIYMSNYDFEKKLTFNV